MNNIYKSCVCLLFTALLFSSCKKFLTQTSQDEIRPSTANDLNQLLDGEGYPYSTYTDGYTDLLTDDIQSTGIPSSDPTTYTIYETNGTPLFTWDPTAFDSTSGTNIVNLSGVDSWKIYYSKIKGCNVVLDYLDKVSGTDQEKNALHGQALFLRAFYYLKLVTLYGQPYSGIGIDPTTSLGVPLVLSSKVTDAKPVRKTLAEVYSQIESDLLIAADLLKNNFIPGNTFRVGHIAAYTLLSRLYLYMGRDQDMDNVIKYATNALAEKSGLTSLTNYVISATILNSNGIYDYTMGPEVIWQYGANSTASANFFPGALSTGAVLPPFSVSPGLMNLYNQGTDTNNLGDLRYRLYFVKNSASPAWPYRSYKISASAAKPYDARGIRVAELYLNRAEASIRRYKKMANSADLSQALSDLNILRQNRYDTRKTTYTPVNITDADALFKFCQDERRRELCLEENFRWVDIKRWGLSVTHQYVDAVGGTTTYTLTSGSKMYALPIPYTAMNRNDQLQQNPR